MVNPMLRETVIFGVSTMVVLLLPIHAQESDDPPRGAAVECGLRQCAAGAFSASSEQPDRPPVAVAPR